MHFEFRSKLYQSASEMHRAIAETYLEDGGHAEIADQRSHLASHTNEECADETIEQWLLDEPEWAEPRAFSRSALIKAYDDLRAKKLATKELSPQFGSAPMFAAA